MWFELFRAVVVSSSIAGPVVVDTVPTPAAVAQPSNVAGFQPCVPLNVSVDGQLRSFLQVLCERSPTFRRQCARIANRPSLSIKIRLTSRRHSTDARAWTRVSRVEASGGAAEVWITPDPDLNELIGHEFEHIVEWLDGVYDSQPRRSVDPSVHADGGRIVETQRAIQVGRAVAREAAAWRSGGGLSGERQ
jgi:hypothetical protein